MVGGVRGRRPHDPRRARAPTGHRRPSRVRIDATSQPRLIEQVDDVAGAVGIAAPDTVHVTLEVNASVSHHGGILGLGGRRALVLGLPALSALSVSELRAMLAHEFAHQRGGDARLGRWNARTHIALERTIDRLRDEDRGWVAHLTARPFMAYRWLFACASAGVSRREELAADAVAAEVAGAPAAARALVAVDVTGAVWSAYVDRDLGPTVDAGRRPPVIAGLRHALDSDAGKTIAAQVRELIETEGPARGAARHPSTRERLHAIGRPDDRPEPDPQPALALVDDLDALETALIAQVTPGVGAPNPIAWDAVGDEVLARVFARTAEEHAGALSKATVGAPPDSEAVHPELVGIALASALHRAGWTLSALPGEPRVCRCGEAAVEPFGVAHGLAEGRLDAATWADAAEQLGIADLPLAPAATPAKVAVAGD